MSSVKGMLAPGALTGVYEIADHEAIFVDEILKDLVENKVSPLILATLQEADPLITGVYFQHGHMKEIIATLELLAKDPDNRDKRYPLVALARDFPENNGALVGIYSQPQEVLLICTPTVASYDADQRKEKSFKPILYPIWLELYRQMDLSGRFMTKGDGQQNYTQIDHYFWGRESIAGAQANIFNDWIDCIEIQKLNLKLYE